MRCPLSLAIEHHQLVFDENRLCNHRTNPVWTNETGNSRVTRSRTPGSYQNLDCVGLRPYFAIRQTEVRPNGKTNPEIDTAKLD